MTALCKIYILYLCSSYILIWHLLWAIEFRSLLKKLAPLHSCRTIVLPSSTFSTSPSHLNLQNQSLLQSCPLSLRDTLSPNSGLPSVISSSKTALWQVLSAQQHLNKPAQICHLKCCCNPHHSLFFISSPLCVYAYLLSGVISFSFFVLQYFVFFFYSSCSFIVFLFHGPTFFSVFG